MGSFPYPRNGILKLDYEFILIFKKIGKAPSPTRKQKQMSAMTKDEWNTYFSGHWYFAGAKQDSHIAVFPEELPTRLIKMFSFAGDTVLDPFLGSGTTCLAANNLSRNSIGYEINPDFIPVIKTKLNVGQFDLAGSQFEFSEAEIALNLEDDMASLAYRFKDPHKFDKKVDPKKFSFGSRIDANSGDRAEYFSVKEIVSAEKLRLDNGSLIRLLGIKAKKAKNGSAIKYLDRKISGQKVFLKYDSQKFSEDGCLLCYLYLKNKTFINAHLIKEGLAEVDGSIDFKYKNKFRKLMEA